MRNPFDPLIAIPRRGIPCTIAGSGIGLKFKALTQTHQNHRAPCHPGDASCKKSPPDASPNLEPIPQPIEKRALKMPRLRTPHTPNRCVSRVACSAGPTTPVPGVCR